MESTDHLFELIKSLTQAEKRYFKLEATKYSSNSTDNDYIKLYEIIEQLDTYDEKSIKSKLKGTKIIKRFASIKNYLYNAILKSLTQLYADSDIHAKFHHYMHQVTILCNRGFYKQAKKKLNQVKKIVEEFSRYDYYLTINRMEVRLAEFEPTPEKCKEKTAILLQEKVKAIEKLKEEVDMELFYEEAVNKIEAQGMARNTIEQESLRAYLTDKQLIFAKESDSIYVAGLAYACEYIVSFMSGATKEQLLKIASERTGLFDGIADSLLKEFAYYYTISIFDHIQILLALKEFETAYKMIDEAERFWKKYKNDWDGLTDNAFFMTIYYHSSKIPRLNGNFEKIADIGKSLKKELEKRINREDQIKSFYIVLLNMAYGYFVLGNHDSALFWIREILNDQKNTIRPDVLGFVYIFHLMLQYEIGNHSILEYQIDRTKRFLSKNNHLRDFERSFLSFFKKTTNLPLKDPGIKDLFLTLKEQLREMSLDENFEKKYIIEFFLIEWIDSKLTNKPYIELIRQKINEQA